MGEVLKFVHAEDWIKEFYWGELKTLAAQGRPSFHWRQGSNATTHDFFISGIGSH
jgi:hypothetical protein